MNISNVTTTIPTLPTVSNPSTDALRRDNHQREVISQPAAAQQSAAEKGVASERERARTPAQNNEQIDFDTIRKQAELANSTIEEEQAGSQEQANPEQGSGEEANEARNSSANDEEPKQEADGEKSDAEQYAEEQQIQELRLRDQEVRAHEQAHASVGGPYTGAPSYTFEVGPDGKKYAVEGEVSVDLSPIKGDPRATITKMQKVYNAALAPADPSIQDTRVANKAAQMIAQAQSDLATQASEEGIKKASSPNVVSPIDSFSKLEEDGEETASDFDRQINATLEAQEMIAPARSDEMIKRNAVIQNLYANITLAYDKPPRNQFELTA